MYRPLCAHRGRDSIGARQRPHRVIPSIHGRREGRTDPTTLPPSAGSYLFTFFRFSTKKKMRKERKRVPLLCDVIVYRSTGLHDRLVYN